MNLPIYPFNVLYRARDAFRRNWFNSMAHNSEAARIYNLQYSNPPRLSIFNTEPYPFEEADSFYPSPEMLFSSGRRNNPSNFSNPVIPDVHYRRNGKRKLYDANITCLTEHALTEIKRSRCYADGLTKGGSADGSKGNFLFSCDVCDEAGLIWSRELAELHLRESGHVSCSRYLKRVGDDLELVTPREIFIKEVSGWRVGDTVVYCPTCHLITPDKLLCAYHHQTLHEGRQPAYSLASVASTSIMKVEAGRTRCEACNITFPCESLLFTHWNKANPTLVCSPFHESGNCNGNSHQRLVNFECLHCGLQRDLTLSPFQSDAKVTNNIHFMGVSMISHLLTHGRKVKRNYHSKIPEPKIFQMRFRFIDCGASLRLLLPPLSLPSHFSVLLFTLKEANRQQELLKKFKKTRKHQLFIANQETDRLKAVIAQKTE